MFDENVSVAGKNYKATVTPVTPAGVSEKFLVRFDNGIDSFETYMCDFATGSNSYNLWDARVFSMWV